MAPKKKTKPRKKSTPPASPAPGALAGLRVLDLTRVLAGPFCTMQLGDMGAEVIKVEQPGRGDDTRCWGPPFLGPESAYFLSVNRNKRGITLNLKARRGQEILRKLIKKSDVVIENFKTGTLDAWGCGHAFLKKNAPGVIHCTISSYGSTGPRAALPGYDFLLQAESGLMSITGEPDGQPMRFGVAIVDLATGLYAASAILAALHARNRGSRGQHVQVSLYATSLALLGNVASNFLITGKPSGRFGNAHPSIVPYSVFRCSDADMALAVGNDSQFADFAKAVGRAEWAADPRFARNPDRVANRAILEADIQSTLGKRTADEWIKTLLAAGVPCSRLNTPGEALSDPQTAAANMVVHLEHPTAGAYLGLGVPMLFSGTPAAVRRAPPTLGQHTEEILGELAGIGPKQIRDLRAKGII